MQSSIAQHGLEGFARGDRGGCFATYCVVHQEEGQCNRQTSHCGPGDKGDGVTKVTGKNTANRRAANIGKHNAADHHGRSLCAVAVIGRIKDIGLTGDKGCSVADAR